MRRKFADGPRPPGHAPTSTHHAPCDGRARACPSRACPSRATPLACDRAPRDASRLRWARARACLQSIARRGPGDEPRARACARARPSRTRGEMGMRRRARRGRGVRWACPGAPIAACGVRASEGGHAQARPSHGLIWRMMSAFRRAVARRIATSHILRRASALTKRQTPFVLPYGEVSVSRDRDSRGVTNAERDRDRDRGALKTHTHTTSPKGDSGQTGKVVQVKVKFLLLGDLTLTT